jgi:glycosyltransferase involved in cell wall biosynthesis
MRIAIGYHFFEHTTGYHIERALAELGHTLVYVGAPSAARAGYDNEIPIGDILKAHGGTFDLFLWIDAGAAYFPRDIETLAIPTACYLIDVHVGRYREHIAAFFDAVFVAQKEYVTPFGRHAGHGQVHWLPLAAAADWHTDRGLTREFDIGFVGAMTGAHRSTPRIRRLEQLASRYRTNDFTKPVAGRNLADVYGRAKIVFNCSLQGDVNMRVFEGAACGALVLTDAIGNGLTDLLTPDKHIVTYRDDAELFAAVERYLADDHARAAIAHAGQAHVHAAHTYTHRARELLATINAAGFKLAAKARALSKPQLRAKRLRVLTAMRRLDEIVLESARAGRGALGRTRDILPALARRLIR